MAPATDARSPLLARVLDTHRALLRPRRLVPFALVAGAMVFAQHALGAPRAGVWIGVGLCAGFFLTAPAAYRVLLLSEAPRAPWVLRMALYVAIPTAVVAALAVAAPRAWGMGPTLLTRTGTIAAVLAMFLVGGWGLGRDVELEHLVRRERERAEASREAARQSQLALLASHLEPHFLFNTLNAIAELCREDGEVAERAILELSALLRRIASATRATRWPLADELGAIDGLLRLHAIRDEQAFEVARDVDPALLREVVPPLLLLPLVENAMKHGPGAGHRGEVRLEVAREDDTLRFTLSNPGPYAGPRAEGTGLPTLEERVRLSFDGAGSLEVGPDGDDRTVATLAWPAARAEA